MPIAHLSAARGLVGTARQELGPVAAWDGELIFDNPRFVNRSRALSLADTELRQGKDTTRLKHPGSVKRCGGPGVVSEVDGNLPAQASDVV